MAGSAGLINWPKALPQKIRKEKTNVLKNTNYSKFCIASQIPNDFSQLALVLLTHPIQIPVPLCSGLHFYLFLSAQSFGCALQTVKNHINLALISDGRSQQKSGHHADMHCCEKEPHLLPLFLLLLLLFFFLSFQDISLGFRTSIASQQIVCVNINYESLCI